MSATPIEWVIGPDGSRGHTVNPIRFRNVATGKVGHYCEKIASGCKNCYSSTMQSPYLSGLEFVASNKDKGTVFFEEKVLDEVLRRRKPTGYFWCDMTDLFGSWVPDRWIDKCFAVMALTPQHRHFVLTKRGARLREYFSGLSYEKATTPQTDWTRIYHAAGLITLRQTTKWRDQNRCNPAYDLYPSRSACWPLPHVWLGVSASTRPDLDAQIEYLRATPAAVRFLSLEPLIADLGAIDLSGISWVIVGGESGPGARPMHPNWARSVRDQCVAAGVPFFFKQRGEWDWDQVDPGFEGESEATPYINLDGEMGAGWVLESDPEVVSNYCGPEPAESSVWLRRIGKKRAGRLLDGREWNELPGGAR